MKKTLFACIALTPAFLLALLCTNSPLSAQPTERNPRHTQSIFAELGGSGCTFSINYEYRFGRDRTSGAGLKTGIGYMWVGFFGESSILSIPFELNYLYGEKRRIAFEAGFSIVYLHMRQESGGWFYDTPTGAESQDAIISYIPFGLRLKPKEKGLMLRFNVGPVINWGNASQWSDNAIDFFMGVGIGYTFMK